MVVKERILRSVFESQCDDKAVYIILRAGIQQKGIKKATIVALWT